MTKGSVNEGVVYHAGFPNAGEDDASAGMSLDSFVVKHRASTYFWRLEADIPELQWRAESLVVVDRALDPQVNRYCVVVDDDVFVIARYKKTGFERLDGSRVSDAAQLWGTITYVVQPV